MRRTEEVLKAPFVPMVADSREAKILINFKNIYEELQPVVTVKLENPEGPLMTTICQTRA